ncbi:G1/S-specific cyclin cln3 [Chamberlinius hualienensis]
MASVIPSLLVKLISPFIVSYITLQMVIVISMNMASFLLVSFSKMLWMTYLGVVLASISGGLGEVTLLKMQTLYSKNSLSAFSSGSGLSGCISSVSYAGITTSGLTPKQSLLIMTVFPVIMAITYFTVLTKPIEENTVQVPTAQLPNNDPVEDKTISEANSGGKLFQMIQIIKDIFPKYIMPLTTVYFCQYFINQGLFELMYFKGIWLSHEEQYRWYQVVYQTGVFISKSSVNVVLFKRLWILSIFQILNLVLFICEAYWLFLPSIWIVFVTILWEGLVGGSTYVSTYCNLSSKVEEKHRHFAIAVTSYWETLGTVIASFLAIPVHQYFCQLPS